jgi:Uma2 family endonuclease
MIATSALPALRKTGFTGLRLTAEEYFALPDDGFKYELIDGVVVMSPSPTTKHQRVAGILFGELYAHIRKNRLGLLLFETDVRLPPRIAGRDLVYRPEIVFIAAARVPQIRERIDITPDLVVEIISPESRSLDSEAKYADYERTGVGEYWLIDPLEERMSFFQLDQGRYREAAVSGDSYASHAVPGFVIDLSLVREAFRSLG